MFLKELALNPRIHIVQPAPETAVADITTIAGRLIVTSDPPRSPFP
jgi:hypothetical protein